MKRRAQGFTIVSAIFILVVLAALGGFLAVVATTQQVGFGLDVQGARAYQAARAGVEWGLYRVLRDANYALNTATTTTNQLSASSGCTSVTSASPTTTTISPLPAPTLSEFTVTVTCYAVHDNTNMGPWVYVIQSTASVGTVGSLIYVERRVRVTI